MSAADPLPDGAASTRQRIVVAAFDLFCERGYDATTVDAVAERAGIARRTFFRHFRSKDDVIFPDHDALLVAVRRHLESATVAGTPALAAVCGAARLVLQDYVSDPDAALQRFRLTRSVPALRDREIASVRRYQRVFGTYLRDHQPPVRNAPTAALRGDVVAAAVVAAHNAVLRDWLRSGAAGDPFPILDEAFAWVADTVRQSPSPDVPSGQPGDGTEGPGSAAGPAAGKAGRDGDAGTDHDGVVVAVFRADRPLDDVVDRIARSL